MCGKLVSSSLFQELANNRGEPTWCLKLLLFGGTIFFFFFDWFFRSEVKQEYSFLVCYVLSFACTIMEANIFSKSYCVWWFLLFIIPARCLPAAPALDRKLQLPLKPGLLYTGREAERAGVFRGLLPLFFLLFAQRYQKT